MDSDSHSNDYMSLLQCNINTNYFQEMMDV